MNKYSVVSIAAALCIIAAGFVYMAAGDGSVGIVLLVCAAAIAVMGAAKAAEQKSKKASGIAHYIPAICFCVLSAFCTAAAIFWFITK